MCQHESIVMLDVRAMRIEKTPHEGGLGRYSRGGRSYSYGGTLLMRGDPPHERVSRTDLTLSPLSLWILHVKQSPICNLFIVFLW